MILLLLLLQPAFLHVDAAVVAAVVVPIRCIAFRCRCRCLCLFFFLLLLLSTVRTNNGAKNLSSVAVACLRRSSSSETLAWLLRRSSAALSLPARRGPLPPGKKKREAVQYYFCTLSAISLSRKPDTAVDVYCLFIYFFSNCTLSAISSRRKP